MISVVKYLQSEFNKSVDFEKLKFMKELINITTPDNKLNEYNQETHYIMQRHFTNKEIVEFGKLLLMYIKIVKDDKNHLKQMRREIYHGKGFLKGFLKKKD